MKNKIIKTLDWFITPECNDNCGFCYAPNSFKICNDEKKIIDICEFIKKRGFKFVGLCGGEPTMMPFLIKVVKKLYSYGIGVSLYTNCARIDCVKPLLKYLYSISIPLDSLEYIPQMRNKYHFDNINKVLELIENESNFKGILKIGTVVTKLNMSHIYDVQEYIKKHPRVNVWKLYQYSPGGKRKDRSVEFNLTTEEFLRVTSNTKIDDVKIITRTREETNGYCVIMDSCGDFYIYGEDYYPTGYSIFRNTMKEISKLYNANENLIQKGWE